MASWKQLAAASGKSQYRACALYMLCAWLDPERCPDSLWVQDKPPFWQIAYHAAFFAHFYMGADIAAFCPWEHHRPRMEDLGEPPEPMGDPYTRSQMLDYLSQCAAMVDPMIDALDLTSRDPGFPWYEVSQIELQIINIRHIQHPAGLPVSRGACIWSRPSDVDFAVVVYFQLSNFPAGVIFARFAFAAATDAAGR